MDNVNQAGKTKSGIQRFLCKQPECQIITFILEYENKGCEPHLAMRKKYPSDINREQFEPVLPIPGSARKSTKPRTMDLYDVCCAALYLLKSGCQWRMIPRDFPTWRTVHSYFQQWSEPCVDGEPGLLEQALKKSGCRNAD